MEDKREILNFAVAPPDLYKWFPHLQLFKKKKVSIEHFTDKDMDFSCLKKKKLAC